jgi:hypothetical protein
MASGLRLPVGVGVSATNACCCRSDGHDPPHETRLCSPHAGLKTTVCFASRLCRPWGTVALLSPAAGQFSVLSFVSFRVHSWFKTTRSEDPAGQISGWKARATKIRDHSCPFVVQNDPLRRPFRAELGLESPSYMKFVSIRVHSWFKMTRSEEPSGQISGWKARTTKIRVHSCSFVVQNDPQRRTCRTDLGLESPSYMKFVIIRVHSWFKTTPSEAPAGQNSGWKARATKIRDHSCSFVVQKHPQRRTLRGRSRAGKPELHEIRDHSCPFVVQNDPLRRTCRAEFGLESTSYKNSCPFVFIRGSKQPAAKPLQGRSRAGKPELQKFVPIRVHSW